MAEPTRAGRQAALRQLLVEARYGSQADLLAALRAQGIAASQGTLSKDLVALGAIRSRAVDGSLVYAEGGQDLGGVAADKLARLCAEMLQSLRSAGNQVLVKTPPGAAQYFAATLDAAGLSGAMGSIAGDDTVLIIASSSAAAEQLSARLSEMTRTGQAIKET